MITTINVSSSQAAALMNGESVTVACEMEQPPEGYYVKRASHKDDIVTYALRGVGVHRVYLPHPKGSEVEAIRYELTSAPMICSEQITEIPIHICTAIVTDVSVVQRDGAVVCDGCGQEIQGQIVDTQHTTGVSRMMCGYMRQQDGVWVALTTIRRR